MNVLEKKFYDDFISYIKQGPVFSVCRTDSDGETTYKLANCELKLQKYDDTIVSFDIFANLYGIDPEINKACIMVELSPQYQKNSYIVDFALVSETFPLFSLGIEIDGHDWHEKNKEQAARDKRRDRELLFNDMPIVRFTGSEIYTNSEKAILEILNIFVSIFYTRISGNLHYYYQRKEGGI